MDNALLKTILVVGILIVCMTPSGVSGSSVQDPLIAEMIQQIDDGTIYSTVYTLENFTTRYNGTAGNIAASTWLHNKLDDISGLTVVYQGNDYRNVIATLQGHDQTSSCIYMVGAHYDTVDLSPAPGATDNGCGVAIVLELARIMSQYSFNHTVVFALWNAEEGATRTGSHVYVDEALVNNLNISVYFNYDSTCYDPENHFILDIMYNSQSAWVKDLMIQQNNLYTIGFTLTYNVHTCSSDHLSFWNHGYTAVMTHEETHGPAHTSDDTVDQVSLVYAKKNGQLGLSVLATLAEVQHTGAPNKPDQPTGETNGKINVEYTYATKTSDSEGDQIYYQWDWGDGTQSTWVGPYPSNTTATGNHTWTAKGSYSIKVKAKDSTGNESVWSDPLPVSMPYSSNMPFNQFWDLFFERFPHAFPILKHLLGY